MGYLKMIIGKGSKVLAGIAMGVVCGIVGIAVVPSRSEAAAVPNSSTCWGNTFTGSASDIYAACMLWAIGGHAYDPISYIKSIEAQSKSMVTYNEAISKAIGATLPDLVKDLATVKTNVVSLETNLKTVSTKLNDLATVNTNVVSMEANLKTVSTKLNDLANLSDLSYIKSDIAGVKTNTGDIKVGLEAGACKDTDNSWKYSLSRIACRMADSNDKAGEIEKLLKNMWGPISLIPSIFMGDCDDETKSWLKTLACRVLPVPTMPTPTVNVTVPPQPTPTVNVTVLPQPAPTVNVTVSPGDDTTDAPMVSPGEGLPGHLDGWARLPKAFEGCLVGNGSAGALITTPYGDMQITTSVVDGQKDTVKTIVGAFFILLACISVVLMILRQLRIGEA